MTVENEKSCNQFCYKKVQSTNYRINFSWPSLTIRLMEFKLDVFIFFVAQQSVYRKDLFLQICRRKIYTKQHWWLKAKINNEHNNEWSKIDTEKRSSQAKSKERKMTARWRTKKKCGFDIMCKGGVPNSLMFKVVEVFGSIAVWCIIEHAAYYPGNSVTQPNNTHWRSFMLGILTIKFNSSKSFRKLWLNCTRKSNIFYTIKDAPTHWYHSTRVNITKFLLITLN